MFTTKNAYEKTAAIQQAKDEGASTEQERVMLDLMDRLRDYGHANENLASELEYTTRTLDSVWERLDEDYQVNSLGELQSSAHDFDRACWARDEAAKNVKRAAHLAWRSGVLDEGQVQSMLDGTPFAHVSLGS